MNRELTKEEWKFKIKIGRWFNKLNEERKECRADYDGLGYTNLCNRLGFEPEDKILYEQGLADRMYARSKSILGAIKNEK